MPTSTSTSTSSKTSKTPMSTSFVQPYIFFGGRCEEALGFYKETLGAQVDFLMRYHESPDAAPPGKLPPGFENKVMHVTFRIGETTLMGSDGCETMQRFDGFSLSLTVPTAAEADRVFAGLSKGGQVTMPMTKTFWSPRFGMLTDRFGLGWMVSVESS